MTTTIIATVNVSESGSVTRVVLTDSSIYERHDTLSTFGSPYLGSFETSDAWRDALETYVRDETLAYRRGMGRNLDCHGSRLAYVDPACSVYTYEIDFDGPKFELDEPETSLGNADLFGAVMSHYASGSDMDSYRKELDYASETAISILVMAGFSDPDATDIIGDKVSDELQTLLMAAMMRSPELSKTLFAAINDHLKIVSDNEVAGSDDQLMLVCACGEVFDDITYAKVHHHSEDSFDGADANEYDFKITTRGEAF